MKTLHISLVLCVYSILDVNAQWGSNNYYNSKPHHQTNFSSSITIQSYDGQPIQAIIDGNVMLDISSQVTIHFGTIGNHLVEVNKVTYPRRNHGYNNITTYEIFNGYIYAQPNAYLQATINQMGQLQYSNNNNNCGKRLPINQQDCINNNNSWNRNQINNIYQQYMSSTDFDRLKQIVESQYMDDTRKNVAMQAVRGNNLSASQVAELMQIFSFESNRLEFAKFAYNYSNDKSNFYLVNSAFRFSSSVDDLNNYIISHS
jgi:hypothetical protein